MKVNQFICVIKPILVFSLYGCRQADAAIVSTKLSNKSTAISDKTASYASEPLSTWEKVSGTLVRRG